MKQDAVRIRGVSHSYRKVQALRELDLDIRGGEVVALLGPNGAGKTTTVRLLLGLLAPDLGTVRVFGGDPRHRRVRQRCGAMLQVGKVPEALAVREHLECFRSYYPSPMPLGRLIATTGLEGLEKRLYGRLSGGQQQRVLLAIALAGNPDLLILDEPTVGLDVESRHRMWDSIRELRASGRSVLLTTHNLEEAETLADRVLVLSQGRAVASGAPEEVKALFGARTLRCRTTAAYDRLAGIPGIDRIEIDERGRVVIQTAEVEEVTRRLLAIAPDLSDLEITASRLEDAFLALTASSRSAA